MQTMKNKNREISNNKGKRLFTRMTQAGHPSPTVACLLLCYLFRATHPPAFIAMNRPHRSKIISPIYV